MEEMIAPKITFGIVLYNKFNYLPFSLASVFEQKYAGEIEIFFCDNSPDGSASEEVKKLFPDKKYQIYKSPGGNHSSGQNLLMSQMTAEHYICGSYDMLYADDFVAKLILALENNPGFDIFAPRLLAWNFDHSSFPELAQRTLEQQKSNIIDSLGITANRYHQFFDIGHGELDHKHLMEKEIFGASGAAFLLRNKTFFDENLQYKNDVELMYRLRTENKKALLVPESRAWHDRQSDNKDKTCRADSSFGQLYFITKIDLKHFSWKTRILTKLNFYLRKIYLRLFYKNSYEKFLRYQKNIKKFKIDQEISQKIESFFKK